MNCLETIEIIYSSAEGATLIMGVWNRTKASDIVGLQLIHQHKKQTDMSAGGN